MMSAMPVFPHVERVDHYRITAHTNATMFVAESGLSAQDLASIRECGGEMQCMS